MTISSTPTLGPWGWQDFGSGPMLVAQHGRRRVIMCARTNGRLVMSDAIDGRLRDLDPDHPNARLIATAPELLEACKLAVANCGCTIAERLSGHLVDCYAPHLLDVIAKAEGRP